MPRNKTKYRLNIRRFLNRKGFHSSAHIIAKVEDTSAEHEANDIDKFPHGYFADIELVIADCSRKISLDFDIEHRDDRQNSMYKIDKLISDLEQFRFALRAEARLAAARERAREAAKEDKKRP